MTAFDATERTSGRDRRKDWATEPPAWLIALIVSFSLSAVVGTACYVEGVCAKLFASLGMPPADLSRIDFSKRDNAAVIPPTIAEPIVSSFSKYGGASRGVETAPFKDESTYTQQAAFHRKE